MSLMEILRFTLLGLGYLLICISLVPLLRSNWWFVRIFDYPRSQKFWANLVLFAAYLILFGWSRTGDLIFLVAMFLNLIYLFRQIWDYTWLAPIQMKGSEAGGETIRLLVANVFQENRNANRLVSLIDSCDPDLVLLVETDQWWVENMREHGSRFPERIEIPLENTYGMLLMSKLKIIRHTVRYLVEDDVPSIQADLMSPAGKHFRLFGLHPKPPVPGESDDSTERDAEILIVGKESKTCKQPVIVAGDLNDVAWSFTTHLFLKVSGLLDPRIGRGFFSTFHAEYRLMRWPLDHVFCSSHFYLHELKRLGGIGSDHFPIFIEVGLNSGEVEENAAAEKHPDAEEVQIAEEKINFSGS